MSGLLILYKIGMLLIIAFPKKCNSFSNAYFTIPLSDDQ